MAHIFPIPAPQTGLFRPAPNGLQKLAPLIKLPVAAEVGEAVVARQDAEMGSK
jgi:hypothetical protein